MKTSKSMRNLFYVVFTFFTIFSTWSCSYEQVTPELEGQSKDARISARTSLASLANEVKVEVSQRDNIPLNQITGCVYFGTTTQGYYEYRLQTSNNGPKIYFVIGIIGDEIEGF